MLLLRLAMELYSLMTNRNSKKNMRKPKMFDECQTPGYVVRTLLPELRQFRVIWECASGEGFLGEELKRLGFDVIMTDIKDGHDFFSWSPDEGEFDCILTNPPYSVKFEWLRRCYDIGKPFALLLPVSILGTKSAQVEFKKHGVEIVLLDKRVNFKIPRSGFDGSGAWFSVAWFTWGFGFGSQLVFRNVSEDVGPQLF